MQKSFKELLEYWPKYYITYSDVIPYLNKSSAAVSALFKRAVKDGILIRLRRELYLIKRKAEEDKLNAFELSSIIYGPSYLSFESALSYHGWIPEAVRSITCACSKRSKEYVTPVGIFDYQHIPIAIFHIGVTKTNIGNSQVFIADPWKAIADLIYVKRKEWMNIYELHEDMRIELDSLLYSDRALLANLHQKYPNMRTKKILNNLLKDFTK